MIHVCFPDYDKYGTYSKYVGIAMTSLLENTKADVTLHLLHDATLSQENRKKFVQLAGEYHQQICFHEVDSAEFEHLKKRMGSFSIGTLFRLSMMELLPSSLSKVIYLDSDLLVNLDIEELWKEDLHGSSVGVTVHQEFQGSCHPESIPWPCEAGIVKLPKYFNAGVMVMDLARIRHEHDVKRECLQFLENHPKCFLADQDALNVMFRDDYFQLSQKYNLFTRMMKDDGRGVREGIIHVSGDYIDFSRPHWWEDLFLRYWLASPWGTGREIAQYFRPAMELRGHQFRVSQSVLKDRSNRGKVIFWGAKSISMFQKVRDILNPNPSCDYFVDNNAALQGTVIHGLRVFSPTALCKEKKGTFVVAILAQKAYSEIRRELEMTGLKENIDFFDARLLLFPEQGGYAGYY